MTQPHRTGRLIIVCGLPGSGKTTIAKALQAKCDAVRFCPDEWMSALGVNLHNEQFRANVEALQWMLAKQLLASGLTAIIEWGTWGQAERDLLRLEARALGAVVELHYLSAPPDVLFQRVRRRNAENPPITRAAFDEWLTLTEVPSAEELALFDEPSDPGPYAINL